MAQKDKYRVYLVNAGNDGGMSSIANDACFPALGVLELGTWLHEHMPDVNVTCCDGQVASTERIIREIEEQKPDLVGVSVLCTSYQNSLNIAAAAKKIGAKVVFGNDQAAQLSHEILRNRPNVDYVIGAEYGEEPLQRLIEHLQGKPVPLKDISTLTYRDRAEPIAGFNYTKDKSSLAITDAFKITRNGVPSKRTTGLDIIPLIDWDLYPKDHWDTYRQNFTSKFGTLFKEGVGGVVTMNRARGCSRSKDEIRCKHCDMLLDIAFSSPKVFWAEVEKAHRQTGANIFYESCDSFSSFPDLVRNIAAAKPKDLGFEPHFSVYCQAHDLVKRPDLVRQLKEIGVYRVNIGLEAGCDTTLKHMKGEHDSVETNYKALQMLKKEGISVYGSFVLGTDAETPQTMRETVNWVKKIIHEGLIGDVEAQPILPLPNNVYGRKMIKEAGSGANPFIDNAHTDRPFDTDTISRQYVDAHSGVTHAQVVEAVDEIRKEAIKYGLKMGSGVSHADLYDASAQWQRDTRRDPLSGHFPRS